jgi:hypothetical protein
MRKSIVLLAAIGIVGLVAFLVRHRLDIAKMPVDDEPVPASASNYSPREDSSEALPSPAASNVAVEETATAEAGEAGYKARLDESSDIRGFAEDTLPAAKAGDPAAQYYLSRALDYCEREYRFYFIRGQKRRTLDEAMQWASTRPALKAEDAREVHDKCKRLQAGPHPFGTSTQWLVASKDNGYALAMMDAAVQLSVKAAVSGATETVEMRNEAKRLALKALASKDPEVIFAMGDLSGLFLGDLQKASIEQWVWRLAACKRGYECGQNAEWYQQHCRFDANCQPYESGIDFIRRSNSEDFDEIDRRANDLNAQLDADDFNWSGWQDDR